MNKNLNSLIIILVIFTKVNLARYSTESGLSIPINAGYIKNHLTQIQGLHTIKYDIPDFLKAQISIQNIRTHLPLSFDFSRIYMVDRRCTGCLINHYPVKSYDLDIMTKTYSECSKDYENCKFYSYLGVKGYQFKAQIACGNSQNTSMDIVQVNTFLGKKTKTYVPNHDDDLA
jgi:hypothetical protein